MGAESYLYCGLLCRGFARLRCGSCNESRLVAFSCKGRGFCPACMGRRMCATAANLIEHVLPEVALVQRTSSDLRLNPHLHVVFLDGAYHQVGGALAWQELSHLRTREVGQVPPAGEPRSRQHSSH